MNEETAKRVEKMKEYANIPMELMMRNNELVNEIVGGNSSQRIKDRVGECNSAFERLMKVLYG